MAYSINLKNFSLLHITLLLSFILKIEPSQLEWIIATRLTFLSWLASPKGSDIAPFLYTIFAHDTPKTLHTSLGTYADDTIILASNDNPQTVSDRLQNHLNMIQIWSKKWKININDSKSSFITFSLRPGDCSPVSLNDNLIPTTPVVEYLGL